LADIDGDGDLDIVGLRDQVIVGINDGTGQFSVEVWRQTGIMNESTIERPVPSAGSCPIKVYGGDSNGVDVNYLGTQFCLYEWYASQVVGDVNGDGVADLVGFGNEAVIALPGLSVTQSLPVISAPAPAPAPAPMPGVSTGLLDITASP